MDTESIRKSLLSKFREVTADRLEKIGMALLALEKDSTAEAPAEDVARELHTMKGEARMLALPRIGEVAHAAEDVLKSTREGRTSISVATDLLLRACDVINELIEDLSNAERPNAEVEALCDELARVVGGAPAPEQTEQPAPPAVPEKLAEPVKPAEPVAAAPISEKQPEKAAAEKGDAKDKDANRSIRVAVDALDNLGALAGDLLVEGARAHLRNVELAQVLQRFNRIGDRWLQLAEELGPRMPELAPALERLEADLHLLRDDTFRFARKNSDGLNTMRGALDLLAEQVAKARLVPLSTVFAAFPRAVRDLAKQQNKEAELNVINAEVGVDRGVLGEVRDALVHLLRNSVDHGLESPELRQSLGKPRVGRVTINVRADGDMLAVEVEDDGRGIDARKMRETAISRGLMSATQAAGLSDREALDLMFLPGFSTRETVSDISGRGVGMDVVRRKVEALGGSVAVTSRVGLGTRISLRLPQSMALMRVLLVQLGNDVYGIPAADVEAVGRVKPKDRVDVAGVLAVHWREKPIALVALGPLLGLNGGPRGDAPPVVYVKHGEDRAAFVVDGFVGEREVAVKPCGGFFLKGASYAAGAASLEDGRVAVLLHIPDVMAEVRRAARPVTSQEPDKRLRILLVDDSPIARATEAALVRALGHSVEEAVDGEDGLTRLASGVYDLVLTDIQMPKMDGITFTRRIKTTPSLSHLPVVVLSSLASPEDKRRGSDAGADAYLVKGELSVEVLAQTLDRLTA